MNNYFKINKSWNIFLDRDGVINIKLKDNYVKNWSEFQFIKGSLDAISKLSNIFNKIIIITNQRGIGRGLMNDNDLFLIHKKMIDAIEKNQGRIDGIYYCSDISESSKFRKPNTGMGLKAKNDFPSIDFKTSIMIGDSLSDMIFGKSLGMKCFMVNNPLINENIDMKFKSLYECSKFLENNFKY